MVRKLLTENYIESNSHKNNMRLDYIEGLIEAVGTLNDADFECDSITAAIKAVYDACGELEDALGKISKDD